MTATPNGVHGRPLTGPRNMKPTTSRPAASPVKHASRQQSSTKPHLTPQTREWWTCTEVKLRITGLPKSAKTSDLYKLFKSQGHIVRIELFENRKAERTQDGQMIFSPPPKEPFWEKSPFDCVSFRDGQISQIPYRLYFTLVDSKRNLKIQSSVDPGRQLKETMVMQAARLDFGFMDTKFSMMCMHSTRGNEHTQTTFTVKLLRRELVIEFPIEYPGRQVARYDRDLDRIKFQIPFRELRTIWEIDSGPGERSLVISLPSPPAFYRKIANLESTHDEGRYWTEHNTWARQTEIADPKKAKLDKGDKKGPLTFRNERAMIDIGRWTTYKLTFMSSEAGNKTYNNIKEALRDYNIPVKAPPGEIRLVPRREASVWDLIDDTNAVKSSVHWAVQISNDALKLPWSVRYQLEACISQGFLNERHLTGEFLERLSKLGEANAKLQLEAVVDKADRFYNPMDIFDLPIHKSKCNRKIPKYCILQRSATVTPSTIYYSSPTPEMSNRILRRWDQYADQFLRVRFTDERSEGRIHSSNDTSKMELYNRVFQCLREGIKLGDRHFYFLAASNSQFREHGAYFFAPKHGLTAERMRADMGVFSDIKSISKYSSRLGQCFSTTRGIHHPTLLVTTLGDTMRNGHNFTDGCGMISKPLAEMICEQLRVSGLSRHVPSLFQFRMGGSKGVTAVWPSKVKTISEIQIRQSQYKFTAKYMGLEIIQWSTYSAPKLNRQLILILKGLQVPDHVFVTKLRKELERIEGAMHDDLKALEMLQQYVDYNQMTLTFANIVNDGFIRAQDPFAVSILRLWRSFSLKLLKEKAAISVKDGAFLLGCVDEATCLRGWFKSAMANAEKDKVMQEEALAEIFVQVPDFEQGDGAYKVIEGICIVARNPSLHPGDIRIVRAVNKPELHHMRDVVVFPQTGDRDVPGMCSGGDLDGDEFVVIWDQSLIPPRSQWDYPAMDFTPPMPATVATVTIEDVHRFFVQYMQKDLLGQIAIWHMANADWLAKGVRDDRCIELARQHSLAVDYVKSGTPPDPGPDLRPQKYPHFMNNGRRSKDQIYHSTTVLGELFDKVPAYDFQPLFDLPSDQRILNAYQHTEGRLRLVSEIKAQYDAAIRRVMAQHEITTEFEVWSTFVMNHAKVVNDYKIHEEIGRLSSTIKEEYCDIVVAHAGGRDFNTLAPWVAAMYTVTSMEKDEKLATLKMEKNILVDHGGVEVTDPAEMPLISFPWLFYRELGQMVHAKKLVDDITMISAAPRHRKIPMKVGDLDDTHDEIAVPGGVKHRGDLLELFEDAGEPQAIAGPSVAALATDPAASPQPSKDELSDRVDYEENETTETYMLSGTMVPSSGSSEDEGLTKGKSRASGYELASWTYRDNKPNTSSKSSDSGGYDSADSKQIGFKGKTPASCASSLHDDLVGVNEELVAAVKKITPSRTLEPDIPTLNEAAEGVVSKRSVTSATRWQLQVLGRPSATSQRQAAPGNTVGPLPHLPADTPAVALKPSSGQTDSTIRDLMVKGYQVPGPPHSRNHSAQPTMTAGGETMKASTPGTVDRAPYTIGATTDLSSSQLIHAGNTPAKSTTKSANKQKLGGPRITALPPAPPAASADEDVATEHFFDHRTWYKEERDKFGNIQVSLPETMEPYNPYPEDG